MIRVLVAEDSPTVRALLVRVLEDDPEIEVVGMVADGAEAVAAACRLKPDVVTMDIVMPRMDGLEATRRIMASCPVPIVIVSGALQGQSVNPTFEALCAGALSVVEKPGGMGHPDRERLRGRVVETVKRISTIQVRGSRTAPPAPVPARRVRSIRPGARARIVAMGASTGGPGVLAKILGGLPADYPAPILVVQHITEGFAAAFARWLETTTPLTVKLAAGGEVVEPGVVYVAEHGRQLGILPGGMLVLGSGDAMDGHCPSATFLFESVVRSYGAASAGVLLTGMGADGARGLKAMRAAGGVTIAQDKASSVVYGMPAAAVALDAAQWVLPPAEIPEVLLEAVGK